MNPRSILYLGADRGTSLDRANAYRRLGHEVLHIAPRGLLPRWSGVDRAIWHLGGDVFAPWLLRALPRVLEGRRFDLCHVDGGELVVPALIRRLRESCRVIINYNIDDPFGRRDGRRFAAYRAAVPHYDVVVVVRKLNEPEARALGARCVLCIDRMSADEVTHAPLSMAPEERSRWASEVLFAGTWMPDRGPFLLELLRLGVPLTIRGSLWERAPEWPRLSHAYRGGPVVGADYARAIQCARISLGLLSRGNRDLHTTRSLEIPALGSLLCAERTSEHLEMYVEGSEAMFWSDAAECARICLELLADERRRAAVARAGSLRVRSNGHFNEPTLQRVLQAAGLGEPHDSSRGLVGASEIAA